MPIHPAVYFLLSNHWISPAQRIARTLVLGVLGLLLCFAGTPVWANLPGGGTGTGPNVTITDNGSTVTMANGLVSIVITKADGSIHQMYYTYNNSGALVTNQLLNNGTDGGELYWLENPDSFIASFNESVVANNGNYAEIDLLNNSPTNGMMDMHYSMLRGSPGFYAAVILAHRNQDGVLGITLRPNIYAGATFNWMSVDANRNRLMEVNNGLSIPVQGAPKETYLWTNGIYAGQYEDKYKYTSDLVANKVWGWSSVGAGGANVGLWNVTASPECYPGGPMERSLMEHIGTTILNVFTGGYYGLGTDDGFVNGEIWSKLYGPYFYYCNNVTNTLTATNAAAQALYADAIAQQSAEQSAWPYTWFTNAYYAPAANRGTVTGTMVINDSGNPNASAANLWVGVVQQPTTDIGIYDFQRWAKPYQFWTRTDTNGNFILTNVIAGANYTFYAFGPGAADTFMSQPQTGGGLPIITDLPANTFAVTVAAGTTTNLGTVIWTPARVGATVFEIGYPNRTGDKFRHGDDYWVGDIGPSPTAPSPIWSKWLEYQFDFPNGVNYVAGQSRWSTDWNFIQPVVTDNAGNYNSSSSTITFNLATAPANGATASLYLGLSSDYYCAIVVSVNGNNLSGVGGIVGTPNNSIPSSGYYVGYDDADTSIREGNNGVFSDERISFPASQLHAGANTINIALRQVGGSYFANHAMYDYVRLELTGYVPPPPASVAAYAGNGGNLISWPVTLGATSYNILRSTTAGSGYATLTSGVAGPVSGCGSNNAVYLDSTAANNTTYYYEVRAVNPTGSSASSPASAGATPLSSISTAAPAAPAGVGVAASGHQSVTLDWNAADGANFYSVWRSTLMNNGGGASNTLSTIMLNNAVTNTSYTDGSPSDGSIYRYFVTATSAGGTSANSAAVAVVPLPAPPATLPVSLLASFVATTNITLNWSPVTGAVGYAIYRATSLNGPYTYLQSVTETTYTDVGLSPATVYYYRVAAVNDAGVSANATDAVNSQQTYPASLSAAGTNAQITLTWSATATATSYTVKRGVSSGNETTVVVSGYAGTTYTNTGLVNGTTYYYVVTASGAGGTSGNSPEASATPFATSSGIWISAASGTWGAATNWSGGGIATGPASTADFSTLSLPASLTVTLDSARSISALKFADTADTYNWTVAGTNVLTLGTAPVVAVLNQTATISTVVAGANGLLKIGAGKLTFGGASNTLTGGVNVSAGNLTLDYSSAGSPAANLLASANALTLGGGTLQINGSSNSVSSQTMAATTLTPGGSVIAAAPAAGASDPVVNLGTLTANAGGVIEFVGPVTIGAGGATVASNAIVTTPLFGTAAFVGGNGTAFFDANYATAGLYDFAATTGTASPYPVVGGSQLAGFYTSASGTAATGGNLDVTGNITGYSGQPYLTSLRFNTSIGQNLSFVGFGGILTLSDILETPNVGAFNVTFSSGNGFRPAGGSSSYGGPFVVWQNNPAGELVFNGTLGNSKVGAAAYVQTGPGTVWINNTASGYTGASYLNGGVTLINGDASLGAAATAATVNLNGGTVVGNATFAMDNAGVSLRPFTLLGNGGGLAATAGNTLTVDGVIGSAANTGPLTIGIPAQSANGNVTGLLPGSGPGTANAAPVYATGMVVLTNANYYTGGTVLQSGTLNINGIYALGGANYGGLTCNGGTLQYAANLTGNNGSGDLTSIGTAGVTLAAGGGTLDLNGNSVTFAGPIGNGGNGALTVKSSLANGQLTLLGANNYSGDTTVTNVTLLADNASGSATGSGNVTVLNGGVLAGNGALAGSVTVTAGGLLAPGNPSNVLAIGNNLTLAAGGKTVLPIQVGPLGSSGVNVANTLTAGGALVVTNTGAPMLTNGASFQLFNAAAYAGAFSSLVLPALATNLLWNTNTLLTSGTLSVVTLTSPTIAAIQLSGTNLTVTGFGGIGNWSYVILTSTNLTGQWTPVVTNSFDINGNFIWTNTTGTSGAQQFYLLKVQ